MNGREEHDILIEEEIQERIKYQPAIIKKYYYWLPQRKSMTTKKNYVNSIIRYSEYLEDIGANISDYRFLRNQKKSDINMYADTISYKVDKNGNKKKLGVGNIRLNLYALKNFYEFLYDEEIITSNPFDRYEMPKDNKENPIVALDKKEITKVKKNIVSDSRYPERDIAIFDLGIRTGLRVTAIRYINIEDVNFEERMIKVVEKGNVERFVYFGEDTESVLRKYLVWRNRRIKAGENAFFISNRGERISYHAISSLLKESTKNIGKKITPHKMRSTCATNIYKKTGDIYLTADVLGHKNLSNTRKYAKIDEENKRKAASILDNI